METLYGLLVKPTREVIVIVVFLRLSNQPIQKVWISSIQCKPVLIFGPCVQFPATPPPPMYTLLRDPQPPNTKADFVLE